MQLQSEDILKVLRQQKDFLHKNFFVKKIGLFGSFARNEANEKSDIDFLVEFDAPLEIYIANRNSVIEYLQKTFGREVDIANPKSLKPHYKERILKQAVYA
jgi:uncharacterized protein